MISSTKGATTYQNDFRWPEIKKNELNYDEWEREKKPHITRPVPQFKRFDTLNEVSHENWPCFNFYHRPKAIIATDPRETFVIKMLSRDDDDLVRKTRPRVIMAPALSLDDAAEVLGKDELDLLLANTYITTWGKASKEAALCIPKKPILNTTLETTADPVRLKPEALGNYMDWKLTFEAPVTSSKEILSQSTELRTEETVSEIINNNDLRLAHDLPKSGYSGYVPKHVGSIPLKKEPYAVTDVRLSVNQAVTKMTGSKQIC